MNNNQTPPNTPQPTPNTTTPNIQTTPNGGTTTPNTQTTPNTTTPPQGQQTPPATPLNTPPPNEWETQLKEAQQQIDQLKQESFQYKNDFLKTKEELLKAQNPQKSLSEMITEKIDNKLPIDYEEFQKLGYTSEMVDIIKGSIETTRTAREQSKELAILEAQNYLGENKQEVLNFTNEFFNSDNFSDTEKQDIKKLEETNPLLIAKLSKVLHESYTATQSQNMINNPFTSRMSNSNDVFKSEADLREAMRSPQFTADKNYRASIISKMNRSKLG